MKKIEITLYEYDELSPEAKERALNDWNEDNNDPFMQSHMINLLKEKLEERGIEYDTDSIDVRYSLSSSQGDGFMFEGVLDWEHYTVKIKHNGHYYHKYSRTIEMTPPEGAEYAKESDEKAFEEVYNAICDEMEAIGYEHIEWITSEERFQEECDAGAYTFEANGAMRNV